MRPILAGIETEYGLHIETRGPEDQIEDAAALVRDYPGERFVGWDYRFESPRSDLRGFRVDRLAVDPRDARYDAGRTYPSDAELRADRVLPNGARIYSDHGHPEYASPECWSLEELALQDQAGEIAVARAGRAYAERTGLSVRLYKNNCDYHGASYGTHESYLVPRALGFERLFSAVTPILIARQVLCGAGKVGSDHDRACAFQLSQRADFLADAANVETLYRRPVFNTRDEPHADPRDWIRLHVVCGDANMISSATKRKAGLVKLALWLEDAGESPKWALADPVRAFRGVSRDDSFRFEIGLQGRSWTTAREVLESYFSAAEKVLGVRPGVPQDGPAGEAGSLIAECRELLDDLENCPERFRRRVDWAAKKAMLEQFLVAEGADWRDPRLRAFDLEYHNLSHSDGLYFALHEMGEVEPRPDAHEIEKRLESAFEPTRAYARGVAVRKFADRLRSVSWSALSLEDEHGRVWDLDLPPECAYSEALAAAPDVQSYSELLRGEP